MNRDVTHSLQEAIQKQLNQSDFDVVGIVPIPAHNDKMIRLRTLQDMLDDFEESHGDQTMDYLIQLKPKKQASPEIRQENDNSFQSTQEALFLPNGKMNIPFLFRNGELLFDSGDYDLAKNIYQTILRSGEAAGVAHYRLGRCFEAEGKYDDAKTHYGESIAYQPGLDCFQRLAAMLVRQNQDAQAAEVMERALNLKDINTSIRYELYKSIGNCWTRAKVVDHAEKSFKKALEINPSADEIRSNLGALYLQASRIPEAKRNFRDAIASNLKNHQALAGLGSCSLAEGDKKSAHEYFYQALSIELNNPTAIFYLVKCAYELKTYAAASKILEEYIQIAPVNPNLLYSLAGLQFHLGRILDAKTTTLKILELQPQHAGAKDLFNMIDKYSVSTPTV
jgi:tetratricopeptide (TPR) repeat protein